MNMGPVEDHVLDIIEKVVVDELLTFTREIPTGLYFSDCEMCDPADRPASTDVLCRLEDLATLQDSEEEVEPATESKMNRRAFGGIYPLETPRATIAPVHTWIKMDIGSPDRMTDEESPAKELELEAIASATSRKAAKRSHSESSGESDRTQLVPSDSRDPIDEPAIKILKRSGFACQMCPRRFKERAHLSCHVKCVHLNIRAYPCHLCSKRFKRSHHLRQHVRSHDRGTLLRKSVIEESSMTSVSEESETASIIEESSTTPANKESGEAAVTRKSNSTPVSKKPKSASIIKRSKSESVMQKSRSTSLTQKPKSKPVIQASTPVSKKSGTTTPRSKCLECSLRSKRTDCQKRHLFTREEGDHYNCISCNRTVWTHPAGKRRPVCEKPHRCPCGRCYNSGKSLRNHLQTCWRRDKHFGNKWPQRLSQSQGSDQDTQSEIGSEASA